MHQISNACRRWGIVSAFLLAAMLAIASIPGNALADQAGWIVQFGTADRDVANAVAVRGRDVYVAGTTQGTLPNQTSAGGGDVYVRRYTTRGELKWTRQFGTSGNDQTASGALDARRKLVVVGGSVAGALPDQTSAGGLNDAFLRAYDRMGNLLWTLQLGTPGNDTVRSVAIAKDGSILAAGQMNGPEFTDAFAMRLSPDGTVRWFRQFGTSGVDEAIGIAVTEDAVYVSGTTNGAFPGSDNAGDFDSFVARLTLDGEVEWITQFGTPATDFLWKVGVVGSTIFVAGHTRGAFPGEISSGDFDGFVAALAPDGRLAWVRQFGEPRCEQVVALAVDAEGAVVAGSFGGVNVPGQGCPGTGNDAFARKYDASGNLLWTIQFGTSLSDIVNDVALKGSDMYLAGATDGELGGPNAGGRDAFVTRIRSTADEEDDEDEDHKEDGDDD